MCAQPDMKHHLVTASFKLMLFSVDKSQGRFCTQQGQNMLIFKKSKLVIAI